MEPILIGRDWRDDVGTARVYDIGTESPQPQWATVVKHCLYFDSIPAGHSSGLLDRNRVARKLYIGGGPRLWSYSVAASRRTRTTSSGLMLLQRTICSQ